MTIDWNAFHGAIAFGVARGWSASLLGLQMRIPSARNLDRRLIAGMGLFELMERRGRRRRGVQA